MRKKNTAAATPPSRQQMARQQNRQIRQGQRDLDREYRNLEREEKKVQLEIKNLLRTGQEPNARILAKELVRIRARKEQMLKTKGQMSAIQHQTAGMNAQASMVDALGRATSSMAYANATASPAQMQQTLSTFDRERQKMDMGQEMVGDMLDDLDGDEIDDETDLVLDEVLEGIGIDVGNKLSAASPSSSVPETGSRVPRTEMTDEEMNRLLAGLK